MRIPTYSKKMSCAALVTHVPILLDYNPIKGTSGIICDIIYQKEEVREMEKGEGEEGVGGEGEGKKGDVEEEVVEKKLL